MLSILDISLQDGMLKAESGNNALSRNGNATKRETIFPVGHLTGDRWILSVPKANAQSLKCFRKCTVTACSTKGTC